MFDNIHAIAADRKWRPIKDTEHILTAAGAHNGLSARLVDEAGFDFVWASGLEISASLGLADADIVGRTESAQAVSAILRATSLPVIVDCDAGYGNAVNAWHTAQHYFAAGVYGLCLEDKTFPKMNSFVEHSHALIPAATMAGKVEAMLDCKVVEQQQVIARTEALIAGASVDEALERGLAYAEAGADAVLVHDKTKHAEKLLEFAERWTSPTPLVCVPTTYYEFTTKELGEAGFSLAIYANQGIRSQIAAVKRVLTQIRANGSSRDVEDEIAPVKEVFALQRLDEVSALFESYVR
ncbi:MULTISPECIES: isocitrate lyase/phosphoenolpyruvate mutase family protein [Actinomycetes]|uniref:isocitrate lyase/phosphoenolpyruvate mutase family protein n=1 Tax=Actinomycetes TaxID=1760 RepID=UPI0001B54A5A|nr:MULTISPECIES: isocitrate lyase/phosphoenolpyruvate mutase family protein [Actinomycetes]